MFIHEEEIPPILNKIIETIEKEPTNKITINEFRNIIIRLRAGYRDTNDILNYFQRKGIIQINNGIIYKTNIDKTKTTTKPGRHKKLTNDEIIWINRNYEPGKTSIRKITKEFNERRNNVPVNYSTVRRALIN